MIQIGNDVKISRGSIKLTHDYSWSVLKNNDCSEIPNGAILRASGKVTIGNHVFIGMNAAICRGVRVDNNVIIGAGSVVTKDCESNSVYAGVPAKRIMGLDEYFEKRKSAQLCEAKILAVEYYKAFRKLPPQEIFHEYFMLFSNAETATKKQEFNSKLKLCDNYEESIEYMNLTKPLSNTYKSFLEYCFNDDNV